MGSAFTLGKRKPIVGNGEELRKITYYRHSKVFLFSEFFSSYFHTCREIDIHSYLALCYIYLLRKFLFPMQIASLQASAEHGNRQVNQYQMQKDLQHL